MKKSYFSPKRPYVSEKRPYTIKTFLGVDYTSPKFSVTNGHAIDIKNFIFKDNIIQKRNGFNEIAAITPINYVVANFSDPNIYDKNTVLKNGDINNGTARLNGIWNFLAEDGEYHIIAHIGNLLYEAKDFDTKYINFVPIEAAKYKNEDIGLEVPPKVCYSFLNQKSFAFVGGNKLWFLGGNKYMCLRFVGLSTQLFPVEDSILVPIPTTTMSITYKDSSVNLRQSLDSINLLTQWRKNKLISNTYNDDGKSVRTTRFFDYELDDCIIGKNLKDLNNIELEISGLKEE